MTGCANLIAMNIAERLQQTAPDPTAAVRVAKWLRNMRPKSTPRLLSHPDKPRMYYRAEWPREDRLA